MGIEVIGSVLPLVSKRSKRSTRGGGPVGSEISGGAPLEISAELRAEWLRLVESLSGSAIGERYDNFVLSQMLALGMQVEWLDYVSERPEDSFVHTIVWHANQRAIRSDPRFIELIEKANITGIWREIGPARPRVPGL